VAGHSSTLTGTSDKTWRARGGLRSNTTGQRAAGGAHTVCGGLSHRCSEARAPPQPIQRPSPSGRRTPLHARPPGPGVKAEAEALQGRAHRARSTSRREAGGRRTRLRRRSVMALPPRSTAPGFQHGSAPRAPPPRPPGPQAAEARISMGSTTKTSYMGPLPSPSSVCFSPSPRHRVLHRPMRVQAATQGPHLHHGLPPLLRECAGRPPHHHPGAQRDRTPVPGDTARRMP